MRLAPSPFILRGRAAEAELTTTTTHPIEGPLGPCPQSGRSLQRPYNKTPDFRGAPPFCIIGRYRYIRSRYVDLFLDSKLTKSRKLFMFLSYLSK